MDTPLLCPTRDVRHGRHLSSQQIGGRFFQKDVKISYRKMDTASYDVIFILVVFVFGV